MRNAANPRPRAGSALWLAVVALAGLVACSNTATDGSELSSADAAAASPDRPADPVVHDPEAVDPEHPPAMRELSFTSGGSKLNGLIYLADGAGPHPTIVLLHGYAGNERNLDLAQALRRAGHNVLYFNYRGSWGSGGEFSTSNAVDDVAAALAMLRERASEYRVDPDRIALVGHSFGGFTAAMATLADPEVRCLVFLAGANMGGFGKAAAADPELRALLTEGLGEAMDHEGGPIEAEPEAVVADVIDSAERFDLTARAPDLLDRPVLLVAGARDLTAEKAVHHDPFLAALQQAGHERVTELVLPDDHYFSAHRIALARAVADWLETACFTL